METNLKILWIIAAVIFLIALWWEYSPYNSKNHSSASIPKKTRQETLRLKGFHRGDKVLVITGNYISQTGKIQSLWLDISCLDSDGFDHVEVLLEGEVTPRIFSPYVLEKIPNL